VFNEKEIETRYLPSSGSKTKECKENETLLAPRGRLEFNE